MMFIKDTRAENFLDQLQLNGDIEKWYYGEIEFEHFVDNWDRKNIGRPVCRVDVAIEEYGQLMDSGSDAPAPIVWLNDDEVGYEFLDGVLRGLTAEGRGVKSFNAYVVLCDNVNTIERIRILANVKLQGGYQPSNEWTLNQAIERLLIPGKATVEQLARDGGWAPHKIRTRRLVMEFDHAIKAAGGPDLEIKTLELLAKVAKLKDVTEAPHLIAEFLRDLKKVQLTCDDQKPYIVEFFDVDRKRKPYKQFEKKLSTFRNDEMIAASLADPFNKKQAYTPEALLLRAARALRTIAEDILKKKEDLGNPAKVYHIIEQTRSIIADAYKAECARRKRGKQA